MPREYQQVEYLKSSGTQYINTGVIANTCAGFKLKIRSVYSGNYNHYPFGSQVGDNRYYIARYDKGYGYNIGAISTFQSMADDTTIADFSISTLNGSYVAKDNNVVFSAGSYNLSKVNNVNIPIYLFRVNYQNAPDRGGEDYIYFSQIYSLDNGESVLTRDFYPCYRKSDNKPGMYDFVTKTFFTNAGTGEFTVGPNV